LLDSENFILHKWTGILLKLGVQLNIDYKEVIQAAVEKELGVRGLIQTVEEKVTQIINENIMDIDLEKISPLYSKPVPLEEDRLDQLLLSEFLKRNPNA
jgi:hypothetical protein